MSAREGAIRVHVVELGWLQFPDGWFRSRTWGDVIRAVVRGHGGPPDAIPILAYVVEHDDGHIVIDTGAASSVAERLRRSPLKRRINQMHVEPNEELGPRMRAMGLRPEDVRRVILTHLHVDHAGGVAHLPNADVLVHRPEWEDRGRRFAYEWAVQQEEGAWPEAVEPTLYDLLPEPYGPFDRSYPLTDRGDVTILPTPGHTVGHVAIAVRTDDLTLLFTGDHVIRQSWYTADLSRGMQPVNFIAKLTDQTNSRLQRFVERYPTIMLPSHDAEAARNLDRWEPLRFA